MPSKIKPEDRTPYVKLMVERFESIAHPKDGVNALTKPSVNILV